MTIGKQSVFSTIKEYLLMTVGMFVYAFAWIGCIIPAHCAGGGATGLSLLIYYATGQTLDVGMMTFGINALLLLVAGFIVGWKFGIKTIYCIITLSVAMSLLQSIFTLPDGTIMDILKLDNRLFSSILGGIVAGIGISICFMQGGSTGGVDIVAMIINKYRTVSYGKIVRSIDFVIIGSAMLLPDMGIPEVIYGFLMTVVLGYTVDMMMSGNQQSSQIMIVCKDYVRMADAINTMANRGATIIDARGWFSKTESKIVMVVCRKRDTSMILKLVKQIDSEAFITVGSVMGVYGKGFDALNKI